MRRFVKHYADAEHAWRSQSRTAALRAGGVPTPPAQPGPDTASVSFDHIEGTSGLSLLAHGLEDLLAPLVRLQASSVKDLAPFDPFLRIRPRLDMATAPEVKAILSAPAPTGDATLHGDLHVGQFIRTAEGDVWLVDLDDLAIGPPEADLANFAAHLATSTDDGLPAWADRVRRAWLGLGQELRDNVFDDHLRIALVRRHLKLREAGRPDYEATIVPYLRESSNLSMR